MDLHSSLYMGYNRTYMKAKLVYHVKEYRADGSIEEIKIWQVPATEDKPYGLKYSFAHIVEGNRIVGYDNFEGKGDHRHYRGKEHPYAFESLEKLWSDFKRHIEQSREDKP
jgi:hypothetical protein